MTSELAASIQGGVLEPDNPGFDEARSLWNTRLDRRPDMIAYCTGAADVAAAIHFARREGMPLSVKGGGHSYAANSVRDGGLLIDLSLMRGIRVETDDRTARVEGGVICAELDAATQAHALATPLATVSSVGVAGAALGGGSGYLSRKFGLLADNVISIDVVTADGARVRASQEQDSDLFWGLRGGGGNFGVVTSMEVRLHDLGPEVLSGQIIYPFDDAGTILRSFRDFMSEAPVEFQCYPFMFRIPPIEPFPEERHGKPALDFVLYHQDPGAADFVRPLRELGEPILDLVAPTRYVDVQKGFDANLPSARYYSKAHDLAEISDAAIDTVVEHIPRMQGAFTATYFEPMGGAIARIATSETPYGGRQAGYGFHCLAGWTDPAEDEPIMGWAASFHEAMAAHATGGVYVNLVADDEDHRIPAAYGDNHSRLVRLKQQWDPGNLFRSNYNIPPGEGGTVSSADTPR